MTYDLYRLSGHVTGYVKKVQHLADRADVVADSPWSSEFCIAAEGNFTMYSSRMFQLAKK